MPRSVNGRLANAKSEVDGFAPRAASAYYASSDGTKKT